MAQLVPLEPIFERLPAKEKRYSECVVFVHHYGGHRHSQNSQIEFVNALGFDAITFDLPLRHIYQWFNKIPIDKQWKFGLRHVWTDKIDEVLGQITEKKFIFSFSSASAAALLAIQRRHGVDICGWICDGGPFMNLVSAIDNLLKEGAAKDLQFRAMKYPILRRKTAQVLARGFGSKNYTDNIRDALQSLYSGFPILSLRGARDSLVPPPYIEEVFSMANDASKIEAVLLPNSNHLAGFFEDADLYKSVITNFLKSHATLLPHTNH